MTANSNSIGKSAEFQVKNMYLSLTDLKVPFHLPPQEKMRVRFTTLKGRQMLNIAEREEITNKGQME